MSVCNLYFGLQLVCGFASCISNFSTARDYGTHVDFLFFVISACNLHFSLQLAFWLATCISACILHFSLQLAFQLATCILTTNYKKHKTSALDKILVY